ALYGCRDDQQSTQTTAPAATPHISSTSAKAAGNFEMDAGRSVVIYGTYLSGNYLSTTRVFIGGISANVLSTSDNVLTAMVPSSLAAGQSYDMYVSNEKGTSKTVRIKILSNLTTTPAPTASITFDWDMGNITKSDIPTQPGEQVSIRWNSANVTSCTVMKTVNGGERFLPFNWTSQMALPNIIQGGRATPSTVGTHVFTIDCSGPNGRVSDSVTHTVLSVPAPTASIFQSSTASASGDRVNVTWGSTNATSCTVMKSVNGGTPFLPFSWTSQPTPNTSGSGIATPGTVGKHVFTISCTGPGGTVSPSTCSTCSVEHTVTAQTASALNAFNSAISTDSSQLQSASGFSYVWNRDLQIGSPYFADVSALQTALARESLYAGEITGGFYNQTYIAVKAFQNKYGIKESGYVGIQTRTKLNSL
ncbi:MAG: peptidoglycan-binding domain-containing protein, partial [Patescibacteria group bacterium]